MNMMESVLLSGLHFVRLILRFADATGDVAVCMTDIFFFAKELVLLFFLRKNLYYLKISEITIGMTYAH
jgi:hypothetical protein